MYLKKSKFFIVGISKSGYASTKLLLSKGTECFIYDSNQNGVAKKYIDELISNGATLVNYENLEDIIGRIDVVVLSPGVPIDNEIPILARRLKKNIIGEMELAYYFCKFPIVAVTGTNGKTTTCSLIDCILKTANIKSCLVGNVGIPLSSKCEDDCEIAVTEVSSFQLETVARFTPHIACVLNISPDHLTRHYNMENYVYLKSRILKNLRESEYAVLNADDERICEFAMNTRGKAVYFSLSKEVDGSYVKNGVIYWQNEEIIAVNEVPLKGAHNLQNAVASVCICKLLGIDKESIKKGILQFKGVKHRMEILESNDDVTYINDSKATNANSTLSALNWIDKPFVLLLGGKEKGGGYEELFSKLKTNGNLKEIIIFGESRNALHKIACSKGIERVNLTVGFENAVKLAFLTASKGDCILLSPACSSLDEFNGYEERGERFIELVNWRLDNKK